MYIYRKKISFLIKMKITRNKSFKTGKDYYNVEKIITRKYKGKNKLYLIKWSGYTLKDCSWEPITHLHNIIDMVESFENNFPNSIDKRLLKKYLCLAVQKENHNIKIKNPFMAKKRSKKKNENKNAKIIICINNSENNVIGEENKENGKEFEKEIQETTKANDDKIQETEKPNLNFDGNLFGLNIINSDEKSNHKLIKPILIW